MALRILQVITDRDRRGAQVFAMDLGDGLRALGADVSTIALAPGTHGDLLPIECFGGSRRSPATMRALRRRAKSFDIVIAHGSSTLMMCAIGLSFGGTPFVYRQISDPLHWAASWPRRLRVGAFVRRAASIVVLSPSVGAVFARHYRLRSARTTVIPNAVPGAAFAVATDAERAESRRRLGLADDTTVVAYVGALAVEKGVDIAIEAVGERPGCALVIAGDGPDRPRLSAIADRTPGHNITFTGPLDTSRPVFCAADIVVLPSRGGDSMPAVLIEAGLCGLPAITTPVGAISDVVVDGRTGIVVPIGDTAAFAHALDVLLDDPERRATLGVQAAMHCRAHFTIEVTAPGWLALLEASTR